MTYLSTKVKHLFVSFLLVFMFFTVVGFGVVVPVLNAQAPDDGSRAGQEANKPTSGFIPLVGIPYVDTSQPMSLPTYINALYLASISIAAFLAVVKIIFAGVKYMLSDVVTSKEDAKKDIRGALIGLLIVIGAVLILNTINPNLSGLDALNGPGVAIRLGSYDNDVNCANPIFPPSCCQSGEEYFLLIDGTALCSNSINDASERILERKLDKEIEDGNIVSKYTLDDIPASIRTTQERFNWIEENWAEPCEYNTTTDTETGNQWVEIVSQSANNILYACVEPN